MKQLTNEHEIRCTECDKKLGEGQYIRLSIKCPRCKTLNKFVVNKEK